MPPKSKLPAPIDRPLSRAYARQFQGWSTAYPPGMSNPTTFRIMKNVMVARDTSVKTRPGLRLILFDGVRPIDKTLRLVGSHEVFFLNDGTKAYLFAAKVPTDETHYTVKFYVASETGSLDTPFQIQPAEDVFTFAGTTEATHRFGTNCTYVKYLQINNKILALSDGNESLRYFDVGTAKIAKLPRLVNRPSWESFDDLEIYTPGTTWVDGLQDSSSTAHVLASPSGLVNSDAAANIYNFGYFYTFFNEIGESAPSRVVVKKVQRPWSSWGIAQSAGSSTIEPRKLYDQFIGRIPKAAYIEAVGSGALGAHLYMATWPQDESIPVEAVRVDTATFNHPDADPSALDTVYHPLEGWFHITAQASDYNVTAPLPTLALRKNYTQPSHASNGLVAADRMVLVNDPAEPAVIRWTSNQQGEYTNFSANRNGGYKTLTSGNLYIPASVKLWQNPQSVDSLTIMCRGIDGMSTGYYMAPAEISSQSESTSIMGFEETTATPGTTSPFGCEVYNSALIHPLDDQLQKSTAANYAIRHKSLTDLITKDWQRLINKDKIVSSEHDGRIYYIVHNPLGADLENDCNGNEVWVLDVGTDTPNWSRWTVQGVSLRRIEVGGISYMSLVRPEGIYVFDHNKGDDDYVFDGGYTDGDNVYGPGLHRRRKPIEWKFETNTQGANRAHDAWAYVQQCSVMLGNFSGEMEWGIRGYDINGKRVEMKKITQDHGDVTFLPWDLEDFLEIRRTMKEWFFFAGTSYRDDVPQYGVGQVSLLQYRYAPSTVNSQWAFGSVETFEYGRDVARADSTSENGVPLPYVDQGRP